MFRLFSTIVIVCAFVGGRAAATEPIPWLILEQTGCLGLCPVFTVRLFQNGRIEYFGNRFVLSAGIRQSKLSRRTMDRLRQKMADSNLAKLPADCCSCFHISDQPWTNLELADKAGIVRVRHYHGCDTAPLALSDLEEDIIASTGARKWIGSDREREKHKEAWFRQLEASRRPSL